MARVAGAKNKQEKNKDYYVAKLKDLGFEVKTGLPESAPEPAPEQFNLIANDIDNSDDKYECGTCGGDISRENESCPHCNEKLDWSFLDGLKTE